MSTNATTIDAAPDEVFNVLMDAAHYDEWVVGAKEIRAVDGDWPEPGSELHHSIGAGPVTVKDSTTLVEWTRPDFVRLEVHLGALGAGIVEFRLEPLDGATKVTMFEVPVDGPVKTADGAVEETALHARNAATLHNLKRVVEERVRASGA